MPKKNDLASIITFPDFDDTAKNIARDAKEINITAIIILSGKGNTTKPYWAQSIECVQKYSIKGIWLFLRSKYVFFTHNHYPGLKVVDSQVIINLWHGMPIKDIGKMDGNSIVPVSTYTIASCEYFRDYFSKAFEMPIESVINIAHPRLKSFINVEPSLRNSFVESDEKFGIWLPTYRHSEHSGGRTDGDAGLDIVGIENIDYPKLDVFLVSQKIIIYIKPHPMNLKQVSESAKNCSNIRFIDDRFLAKKQTSLYEVMALSDFLVTDISSVYFDYKILNKKIIIAFCDKEKYTKSRCVGGRSYEEIITEPVIRTQEEFIASFEEKSNSDSNFEYMEFWKLDDIDKNIFSEISKIR